MKLAVWLLAAALTAVAVAETKSGGRHGRKVREERLKRSRKKSSESLSATDASHSTTSTATPTTHVEKGSNEASNRAKSNNKAKKPQQV